MESTPPEAAAHGSPGSLVAYLSPSRSPSGLLLPLAAPSPLHRVAGSLEALPRPPPVPEELVAVMALKVPTQLRPGQL